ncbi:MAG TPA: protein kinase [Chitinispirillaceae bacterium]|nr:protein kinase [Chitinispirillaceae bacterium]
MEIDIKKQAYGRYQVVKLLGEGAMGRVYLAEDPVLDRLVALKIIAIKNNNNQETMHEYIKRFNLEAKASARLNHPSIVTIYDAGEDDGDPWIAFEFVKGLRLDQYLRSQKQLPFDNIRMIITQLASALAYAHEMGIIHRDIKPQNILIDERTSIAKLADFGVAKAPWVGLTQEGNSVGSPGYMSPEQIDGNQVDTRSDLFSLGIVFYELITGKHPFIKDSIPSTFFATVNGQYQPIAELRQDVPVDFISLTSRLLQADREKRIGSAYEILDLIGKNTKTDNGSSLHGGERSETITDSFMNFIKKIWTHENARLFREICNDLFAITKKIASRGWAHCGRFCKKYWRLLKYGCTRNLPAVTGYLLSHRKISFALILSVAALLFLPLILKPSCNNHKRSSLVKVRKSSHLKKVEKDLDHLFSANLFDSLKKTADQIIEKHGKDIKVAMIQARLALKEENFSDALRQFSEIADNGGERAIRDQREELSNDLESILSDGEASESLLNLCTGPLWKVVEPYLDEWTKHKHYWVRWNSVKISTMTEREVDMVEVYILDLMTGGSIRTRIKAAEKLGQLGDKRAVEPLEEISNRGIRDPFVSTKATRVLEEYFKE